MLVGGVKVDNGAFAADGGEELMHSIAVRRLTRARWTNNQLGEWHSACWCIGGEEVEVPGRNND